MNSLPNKTLSSFSESFDYGSWIGWRDFAGRLHREAGPAVIYKQDNFMPQEWWWHGYLHRYNDLPARVYSHGRREWFFHGVLHRETGPALIIDDTLDAYALCNIMLQSREEWESYLPFDEEMATLLKLNYPESYIDKYMYLNNIVF